MVETEYKGCFDGFEETWLQIPKAKRKQLFREWMNSNECVWDLIRRYENVEDLDL